MKTILITDTHFGTKQNSMTWLNSQSKFIYQQLIPYIKEQKEPIKLIHLGDVFDSRSTISTIVADRVVHMFKDISQIVDEFIIIGGNHDYYSPNNDMVDTISLLLGHLNIKIVTKNIVLDGENIYVPWYQWAEHKEELQKLINDNGVKNVFTHADIINEPVEIECEHIYSGHIHIPYCKGKLRNLGSTYYLNFADSNQPRGFYVIHEDNRFEFIENNKSIKFHRLYNEDIFTIQDMGTNDYIELYINQNNMMLDIYVKKINFITKTWKNVWIIPQASINGGSMDESVFEGYNIESIARELIPTELQSKFEMVINNLE